MDISCQQDYEICSHRYDPEMGDPELDIEPGTPLDHISDDWICPRCRENTHSEKLF